jgi:hypothetical protein
MGNSGSASFPWRREMFKCWDMRVRRDYLPPHITRCLSQPYKIICLKKPISEDGGLRKYNSSTDNIIRNMTVTHKTQFSIFSCQSINFTDIFIKRKQKLELTHDCHLVERSSITVPEYSSPRCSSKKCLQRFLRHCFHYLIFALPLSWPKSLGLSPVGTRKNRYHLLSYNTLHTPSSHQIMPKTYRLKSLTFSPSYISIFQFLSLQIS